MTLATHILVAGAATKPFMGRVNDLVLFIIAVFSHYLSDAITHYDYGLLSIPWHEGPKKDLNVKLEPSLVVVDLLNIAIDVAIGVSVLILCVGADNILKDPTAYGLIILGGILPDALQPIYLLWKEFPMTLVQNFHDFWHSEKKFLFSRENLKHKLKKELIVSQASIFILAALINYWH